ncbi:MAG: hypothetical protein JO346_01915 [Alphaproteobacteria bacterium]|nr:hypothetical protein [Alphaproteobacteria bacterium]
MDETFDNKIDEAEAATAEAVGEAQSMLARLLDVVSRIRGIVTKTVADAGDATIAAEDKVEKLYTDTVDVIEREPVISAALAFGIGCAVGYVLFARRNSRY